MLIEGGGCWSLIFLCKGGRNRVGMLGKLKPDKNPGEYSINVRVGVCRPKFKSPAPTHPFLGHKLSFTDYKMITYKYNTFCWYNIIYFIGWNITLKALHLAQIWFLVEIGDKCAGMLEQELACFHNLRPRVFDPVYNLHI